MNKQYIWYLSYGSNMNMERFLYYIKGGKYLKNGTIYNGCDDKSDPIRIKSKIIEYELYFAKQSLSWGKGGVCFIKPTKDPKIKTYARMYLISYEQYLGVWKQEGKSWYGKKIEIGTEEGYKIYTFTSENELFPKVKPSKKYEEVVIDGLKETFPQLSLEDINNYLKI